MIDAHLPRRLCAVLAEAGYDAVHTSQLPHGNCTPDDVICDVSIAEERVVVTKDADFYYSLLLRGRPYKLLLIRTGNLRAHELIALIRRELPSIITALNEHALVEIDRVSVRGVPPA